jgi:uncharacterized protein involved in exopolysaccharide biosynthesis
MSQTDNKYVERKEEGSNFIEQIISKFIPYWPLLLLFVIISLIAAYIFLRYATPVYEAAATIIIKDDKRGTNDNRIMDPMVLISANKDVENEIEVLSSRSLMENVVKRLCLYAPIYQKGQIKTGDAYITSPITIEAKNPDSIIETENVNFLFEKSTQTVLLDNKERYPINKYVNSSYGVLRFLPNKYFRPGLDNKKQLEFSIGDYRNIAVDYLKNLKVASAKSSALVDISFRDAIPQRAVDVI